VMRPPGKCYDGLCPTCRLVGDSRTDDLPAGQLLLIMGNIAAEAQSMQRQQRPYGRKYTLNLVQYTLVSRYTLEHVYTAALYTILLQYCLFA
jgi:hypothetical protein